MPSHRDARLFMVRIYVDDWDGDAVPTFHIERTSGDGEPPPPPSPEGVTAALDRAANWLEVSIPFWNDYLRGAFDGAEPNRATPARAVPGGADNLMYGSLAWELADGEALVVTSDVADADYWGWTIHTAPWFESGDYANRQTSLSGRHLHVDDDGLVRLVVAHTDPGAPNWIDTEGRRRGLLVFRLVGARAGVEPRTVVVTPSEVRTHLPEGHPVVSPDERRAALRRRRASVDRRLR